jgi:hypothetical protein
VIQLAIAIFGLTCMYCALSQRDILRKWAPVIGLAGQPFWFLATVPNAQWGMVALCVGYTLVYINACMNNFGGWKL